eukprot:TRINITY_DN9767_c0_g1_i1.p1 TRINITY_DN9767_c0_g1~~TRINITY_DN9767_c0_g1_i1.p1  ORF type:complete len:432 (-),score=53.83 TRINITY_DN9767_c0_g1_i1:38-1333(-)
MCIRDRHFSNQSSRGGQFKMASRNKQLQAVKSFSQPFFTVFHKKTTKKFKPILHRVVVALLELEDGTILSATQPLDCIKQWQRPSSLSTTMNCIQTYDVGRFDFQVLSLHQVGDYAFLGHFVSEQFRPDTLRFWSIKQSPNHQVQEQQQGEGGGVQSYYELGGISSVVALKKQSALRNTFACANFVRIQLYQVNSSADGALSVSSVMGFSYFTEGSVMGLYEQADEMLVSVSRCGTAKWWSLRTWNCVCSYNQIAVGYTVNNWLPNVEQNTLVVLGDAMHKAHKLKLEKVEYGSVMLAAVDVTQVDILPSRHHGSMPAIVWRKNGGLIMGYQSGIIRATDETFTKVVFECGIVNKTAQAESLIELKDGSILAGMENGSISLWLLETPKSLVGCCCYVIAQHIPLKMIKQMGIPDELSVVCCSLRRMLSRTP